MLFVTVNLCAQNNRAGTGMDARLLNHYSAEELNEIKNEDTLKFNTVLFYYTQSYRIETIACTDCVPVDTASFDISVYERLRKKTERVTVTYPKYGMRLTLFSIDELKYKMPSENGQTK